MNPHGGIFQPQYMNVPVPEGGFRQFDGPGLPHTRQQMPPTPTTPLPPNLAQGGRLLTQEDARQNTAPFGEPGAGIPPGVFASGDHLMAAPQPPPPPRGTRGSYSFGGI